MEILENENFKIFKIKQGPLLTNCYLTVANDTNETVAIDLADFDNKLLSIFQEKQLNLKFVLLTHGHFDHITGLSKHLEILKNCDIYLNKFDEDMLNDPVKNASFSYDFKLNTKNLHLKLFDENKEFILNDKIKFQSINTPGHTKGSTSFLLNDEFLFTGDSLFKNSVGRTDLFSGSNIDTQQTIAKFRTLNPNLKVLPGHGGLSTLKSEFLNNPAFQL